jgi:hypothetical protein
MATNAAGELVGMLFSARNIAHTVHLKTNSYAEHKTLNEFYDGIIPLVDDFAEAYQGRYGVRLDIPVVPNKYKGTISEVLRSQLDWIEGNRQSICPRTETALHNIIDEIAALYQSTLFMLTLK